MGKVKNSYEGFVFRLEHHCRSIENGYNVLARARERACKDQPQPRDVESRAVASLSSRHHNSCFLGHRDTDTNTQMHSLFEQCIIEQAVIL